MIEYSVKNENKWSIFLLIMFYNVLPFDEYDFRLDDRVYVNNCDEAQIHLEKEQMWKKLTGQIGKIMTDKELDEWIRSYNLKMSIALIALLIIGIVGKSL